MKVIVGLLCIGGMLALGCPVRAEEAAMPASAAPSLKADIKLGTGIESLEVTGSGESFDMSVEKVVGWSLVEGAAEPTEITHVWMYNGNEISSIVLPVKSSRYRTFTRKTVSGMPGAWTFQVKDANGNVLGEKKFEVTNSPGAPATTAQ